MSFYKPNPATRIIYRKDVTLTLKNIINSIKNIFNKKKLPVVIQAEIIECGHACLSMILKYHGSDVNLSTLRRIFPTSLKGVSLTQLITIAKYFNFKTKVFRLEPEQLKTLSTPAILHWDMNHYVVLKEINKDRFVIHDPAKGIKKLNYNELSNHFTGIALELKLPPCEQIKQVPRSEKILKTFSLLKEVSGLKKEFGKIIFLALLLQIMMLIAPKYMQLSIDKVVTFQNYQLLILLVIAFFSLKILETFVTTIRSLIITNFGIHINLTLGTKVFNHLMKLPLDYFEKRHLGDVLSRFGSIEQIRQIVTQGFIEGGLDGFMALLTLGMMFYYNVMLALIVVTCITTYLIIRLCFFNKFREANKATLNLLAIQNSNFMEGVRGIQPIKIFDQENNTQKKWFKKYLNFLNSTIKVSNLDVFFNSCKSFFFGTELIFIIFLGVIFILQHKLTIGMLYAFVFYQTMFAVAAENLIQKCWGYRMLSLYMDRLSDILNHKPENLGKNKILFPKEFKTISTKNLCFRYSDFEPYVIKNLNITIHQGDFVAIVGPSGCGKTTLLKLLMGLLTPSKGEILFDNEPLNNLNMLDYRNNIAAVMQNDSLFAGSIAENISFFDPINKSNFNKIQECTKIAGIFDDINKMPMDFYTLVGDMGSTLSGGQKQRILLARSLYKNPKILFLDEATSHLDINKEEEVNNAIKKLGITRIIAAHRQETIAMANKIIQLDNPENIPDKL